MIRMKTNNGFIWKTNKIEGMNEEDKWWFMDGNDLAEKLKELKLWIDIELVEKVIIKSDWYKSLW